MREVNISTTIVSRWSAEVPRTPEESVRYSKLSSSQEEENIWDTVTSRCPEEMEASCGRGVKGETKETKEGAFKVMLSNSVYLIKKMSYYINRGVYFCTEKYIFINLPEWTHISPSSARYVTFDLP